jgi:DNA primase catalytic subunit
MKPYEIKKYYGRDDIQKALLDFAKDREIAVMFDSYFGKRPDIIENIFDVKNFVKKGVRSFHSSEERWANPLLLGDNTLNEVERAKNRIGWDLILDLDGVDFELSRLLASIICDYLKEIGIKSLSIKFSGNKGFHIGIPFEAFSEEILGIGKTKDLFPDVARKITSYLIYELKNKVAKSILEKEGSIEKIAKKYGFNVEDLISNDPDSLNFNWMKLIEIDTILIASRHLFRMPYSLNEKSGLVSVPVKLSKIEEFDKNWAKPFNVKPEFNKQFEFLKYNKFDGKNADILLIKSYEEDYLEKISNESFKELKNYKRGNNIIEINEEINIKDFPETIKFVLENNFEDGKKRALFLLLTYLYSIKWSDENIEEMIYKWNQKQGNPLKKNYIQAQLSWFKIQQKKISPPNYDNDNYFKNIGIREDIIKKDRSKFPKIKSKNPLHTSYLMLQSKKK